jgi:hypothetical protein
MIKMRKIQFDAEFWPSLHEKVHMNKAVAESSGRQCDYTTDFYENLTRVLTELSLEQKQVLQYDFKKYPMSDNKELLYGRCRSFTLPYFTVSVIWSMDGKDDQMLHVKCLTLRPPLNQ